MKIEIDKLKVEVRNKLDKTEKLKDVTWDEDCEHCMSNPFTLDAIETEKHLGKDKELATKQYLCDLSCILLISSFDMKNSLSKIMVYFMQACAAGIIVGGKVPVVVPSRADNKISKLASIAASIIAAQ